MVQLVGRQPFGQQRMQPAAARLKAVNQIGFKIGSSVCRLIGLGPAQHHVDAGRAPAGRRAGRKARMAALRW